MSSAAMSDPRFARLKSDPRFRRIRQKEAKVVVDDRFKSIFGEGEKKKKGKKGKGTHCNLTSRARSGRNCLRYDHQDESTGMVERLPTHRSKMTCGGSIV